MEVGVSGGLCVIWGRGGGHATRGGKGDKSQVVLEITER
jgi:hypothetical protein